LIWLKCGTNFIYEINASVMFFVRKLTEANLREALTDHLGWKYVPDIKAEICYFHFGSTPAC
jgi:hypothetical protein